MTTVANCPGGKAVTERQKLYTVGTLSYTTSALVTLFFLLLLGDFA